MDYGINPGYFLIFLKFILFYFSIVYYFFFLVFYVIPSRNIETTQRCFVSSFSKF